MNKITHNALYFYIEDSTNSLHCPFKCNKPYQRLQIKLKYILTSKLSPSKDNQTGIKEFIFNSCQNIKDL
jgi:hypothetical protein